MNIQTQKRPLRIAIIGAGPAGFYAAQALLKNSFPLRIDVFEKLPSPFGLVRYGVAPDHQKVKNVIKVFQKTAENPSFHFYGNVEIGKDLAVDELKEFYDAMIFCYGTEADRKLGIPGENLKNSSSATEFVGWYNGLPKFRNSIFDFSHSNAVVIGNGNVAMDVTRILCSRIEDLKNTDISQYALNALAQSKIKEVHVYARRGPAQAAFTPKELREIGELPESVPVIDPGELILNDASLAEVEDTKNPATKKNYEILKSFANRGPCSSSKKIVFHFKRTPVEIFGREKVEKIRFVLNEMSGPPFEQKVSASGFYEDMDCGLVLTSIGYQGLPLKGLPFLSEWGIVPNHKGRVIKNNNIVPGFYVAGWIKRGPSGVIGVNKEDAEQTVAALLEDLKNLSPCSNPSTEKLLEIINKNGTKPVTYLDWNKIDLEEIRLGTSLGKPREKLTSVQNMLSYIDK